MSRTTGSTSRAMSTTISFASPYGIRPGERAAAAHAVAAAVVDDDQVGAAGLGELRREAGSGAGADDRHARGDLRAQPRERLVARHRVASISSCSRSAIAVAKAGSLISSRRSCTSTDGVERLAQPGDAAPRRPRRRGTAGPATAIIETPPSGTNSAVGPVAAESLRPIRAAELGALLGRRAHQRDRRVVDVEVPPLELRRHRLARAEVDHVERAERDDLRQAGRARRLEPVGPGREHAADELVGQLGRRHVEHAGEEAARGQRLHRLAAGAGGVEDEHLVAELLEPLARAASRTAS